MKTPKKSKDPTVELNQGDALVILRKDGSVETATIGIDPSYVANIRNTDPDLMTEDQISVLNQGQKLLLLSMAASSDDIMHFLANVSLTPGGSDLEKMQRVVTRH